jgi:hypothetical protein
MNHNNLKDLTPEQITAYCLENPITKGTLMNLAFNNNTRNIDPAIPREYYEATQRYGGPFYFVMDYQTDSAFGKLTHLAYQIAGETTPNL